MIAFTMLLQLITAFICIFYLAWLFRTQLVEVLPVFTCVLVLVLYVLALIRHLSWIDGIEMTLILLFVIRIIRMGKEKRQEFGRECLTNMTHPSFIAAVFLLAVTAVCTSGKVVTWWDDINFWAADVKSLYFLDGFAGKYGNVAPEFGDYPPGAQLIKWWFLHLDPYVFREGLAFVGYYMMNLVFMLPLLRHLKGRNVFVMVLMAGALWFFPSIAEVYGYDGFCADLTMACIYGGFLLAVTDTEKRSKPKGEVFYYGRLALYLGVLVLVKSIGFVWALFGLVFLFLYERSTRQGAQTGTSGKAGQSEEGGRQCKAGRRVSGSGNCGKGYAARFGRFGGMLAVTVVPILTGGSWMLFCLLMRRVTKTTATAVKYMTTDEYGISGYTGEFARAFLKAFVSSPLHKEKSIAIDLTPLGLYLCICVIVILFYCIGNCRTSPRGKAHGQERALLPRREGRIVLWFGLISGALFYGIIFVAHITIFATETQYLEASGMISSIERYGAPFTIGTLLFLAGIWLERGERLFQTDKIPVFVQKYGVYLGFILFVALTAGYRVGYHGLIGYRNTIEECLAERDAMIEANEAQFLEAVRILGQGSSTRVCCIRRGDVPRWVNNSYVSYEASPVSVVYQSVNLDDAPTDWMVQEIRASHAAYLYAEETDADAGAVFDEITQEGAFCCGALYRIADDGTKMELTRVSQNFK